MMGPSHPQMPDLHVARLKPLQGFTRRHLKAWAKSPAFETGMLQLLVVEPVMKNTKTEGMYRQSERCKKISLMGPSMV